MTERPEENAPLEETLILSEADLDVGRKPIDQMVFLQDPAEVPPIVQIDNGLVFLFNHFHPALIAAGRSPINRTTAEAFYASYANFRQTILSPLYGLALPLKDGLAINLARIVSLIVEGVAKSDITDEAVAKLSMILSSFTVFLVQYRAKPSQAWAEFITYAQNTLDYDPVNY